jgi:prophage regulatory protein
MKQNQPTKLLRVKGVMAQTGLSRSYIYQLVKKQKFPKPVNLVEGGTSVAWLESEVQEWIEERVSKRSIEI